MSWALALLVWGAGLGTCAQAQEAAADTTAVAAADAVAAPSDAMGVNLRETPRRLRDYNVPGLKTG